MYQHFFLVCVICHASVGECVQVVICQNLLAQAPLYAVLLLLVTWFMIQSMQGKEEGREQTSMLWHVKISAVKKVLNIGLDYHRLMVLCFCVQLLYIPIEFMH